MMGGQWSMSDFIKTITPTIFGSANAPADADAILMIPYKDLKKTERCIGDGAEGTVYEGTWKGVKKKKRNMEMCYKRDETNRCSYAIHGAGTR